MFRNNSNNNSRRANRTRNRRRTKLLNNPVTLLGCLDPKRLSFRQSRKNMDNNNPDGFKIRGASSRVEKNRNDGGSGIHTPRHATLEKVDTGAVEDNSADPVENIDLISSPILAYPIPESIFPIPKSAPIAPISAPPTSALASDQVYNNPTISSLPIPESIFPIPKSVPIAPVSAPPTSAPVSGLDFRIHDNSNCAPFGPVPRLVPLSRQENPFWLLDEIINFGATELTYTIDLFTYPVKLDE